MRLPAEGTGGMLEALGVIGFFALIYLFVSLCFRLNLCQWCGMAGVGGCKICTHAFCVSLIGVVVLAVWISNWGGDRFLLALNASKI